MGIDMTSMLGQVFGKLTVIERDISKPSGHGCGSYWVCKCECGNKVSVARSQLARGRTRSCGCLRKDVLQKRNSLDITGRHFGYLIAKENTYQKNTHNSFIWRCECSNCGNTEYYCSVEDLQSGKVNSCGCKHKSLGEQKIEEILIKNNIIFHSQQKFDDLVSDKNYPLKYDFSILDDNKKIIRLIEFDGEQHYNKNSFYYSEYQIKQDKIKNQYANQHNIPLVRIPYNELDNLSLELIFSDKYLIRQEKIK